LTGKNCCDIISENLMQVFVQQEEIVMLETAKNIKELDFTSLMAVYVQGNRINGAERYPDASEGQQLLLAEQDFYQYLRECFFCTPGATYYIWKVAGKPVSALRIEPYQDGLLLEALETAPEYRCNGYGTSLVQAVLLQIGVQKVYSHVHKRNVPSLNVHVKCGFRKILNHAVYLDGSVTSNSVTLLWEPVEN